MWCVFIFDGWTVDGTGDGADLQACMCIADNDATHKHERLWHTQGTHRAEFVKVLMSGVYKLCPGGITLQALCVQGAQVLMHCRYNVNFLCAGMVVSNTVFEKQFVCMALYLQDVNRGYT